MGQVFLDTPPPSHICCEKVKTSVGWRSRGGGGALQTLPDFNETPKFQPCPCARGRREGRAGSEAAGAKPAASPWGNAGPRSGTCCSPSRPPHVPPPRAQEPRTRRRWTARTRVDGTPAGKGRSRTRVAGGKALGGQSGGSHMTSGDGGSRRPGGGGSWVRIWGAWLGKADLGSPGARQLHRPRWYLRRVSPAQAREGIAGESPYGMAVFPGGSRSSSPGLSPTARDGLV